MDIFEYPARYTDERGTEAVTIRNDGECLSVTIRGQGFSGRDFDLLAPAEDISRAAKEFCIHKGYLCSCRIECSIAVPMLNNHQQVEGILHAKIILGNPDQRGGLDDERVSLSLDYEGNSYTGSGSGGWWEGELMEIQAQLPMGVHFRTCIGCLYSDYTPYGHGSFGYMMCFRNLKAEYRRVKTKDEFWSVHDRYDRLVQEIHWCEEFAKRIPGTGYRG